MQNAFKADRLAARAHNITNTETDSEQNKIWNGLYPRISFLIKKHQWQWESIAASFGLGGGILSMIVGVVCDVSVRVSTSQNSIVILSKVSVFAFFLCLPLLFLGSHYLDLLERK